MKNIEVKDLPAKFIDALGVLKKYTVFMFILLLLGAYGFLVIRINSLAQVEPDDAAVADKLTSVQRPKIDEDEIKKIEQLQENNIEVQTLFQQARDNPFAE